MSTEMIWQTVSIGSEHTERLGRLLGEELKSPEVIELRADLGGGKTTFVRGLALGFGSQDTVTSPTFTLNKIYQAKKGQTIHHFDFYRLSEPGIVADQLAESLQNQKVITVVEWSDIVQNVLPEKRLIVEFKMVADNPDERQINISYPDSKTALVRKLETNWQESRP